MHKIFTRLVQAYLKYTLRKVLNKVTMTRKMIQGKQLLLKQFEEIIHRLN